MWVKINTLNCNYGMVLEDFCPKQWPKLLNIMTGNEKFGYKLGLGVSNKTTCAPFWAFINLKSRCKQ